MTLRLTLYTRGNNMSSVPLAWAPDRNLHCSPAVAVVPQLSQHTWGNTGRTSGMAPGQREACYTLPSALLLLLQKGGWIQTLVITLAVIIIINQKGTIANQYTYIYISSRMNSNGFINLLTFLLVPSLDQIYNVSNTWFDDPQLLTLPSAWAVLRAKN